jgi:hypothetical protein
MCETREKSDNLSESALREMKGVLAANLRRAIRRTGRTCSFCSGPGAVCDFCGVKNSLDFLKAALGDLSDEGGPRAKDEGEAIKEGRNNN